MQYLRQNADRLVVRYMLDKDPDLIIQLNLKEWFWSKEGKAMGWAILKAYKDGYKFEDPDEDIWKYIDRRVSDDVLERLADWINIDLPDRASMQQVILYFKFMGMFHEMYYHRENFSDKEVTAIQAIAELVKRGEVTQKVINIVHKLYERHVGEKFYNKKMKQQLTKEKIEENKNNLLKK